MKFSRGIALALLMVAIMIAVPLTSAIPEQSNATVCDGGSYSYTLTYDSTKMSSDQSTNSALSVNGMTAIYHPSHSEGTTSGYGSWVWDKKTGLGPFNSFYAAFDMEDGNKFYAILNPFNLTKTIGGDTIDSTKYNIMWVLPTVYISSTSTSLTLSNSPSSGGVAYAHTINGHVYNYIAIGVYEGSTKTVSGQTVLTSESGATPTVSQNRATFRDYAHNYGTNGQLNSSLEISSDYHAYSMQWNFYQWELYKYCCWTLMENFNSQAIVGGGHTYGSTYVYTTGETNSSGPYAGTPMASASEASTKGNDQVKLFVEGAWGGVREFVDGVIINGAVSKGYYVDTNAKPTDETSGANITYYSSSLPSSGYQSSITTNPGIWGMGSANGANDVKGTTDYYSTPSSDDHPLTVGGASNSSNAAYYGLSFANAYDEKNISNYYIGARLAFVFDKGPLHKVTLKPSDESKGGINGPSISYIIDGVPDGATITISDDNTITVNGATCWATTKDDNKFLGWRTSSGFISESITVYSDVYITAVFGDPDSYVYVIDNSDEQINWVDVYTGGGIKQHITTAKNNIWDFNKEGIGPFNSFYAAIGTTGDNAGKIVFILDPDNLKKRIDGVDLTEAQLSEYNIVWVIPTVYWSVVGNSLIISDESTQGTAYAHTIYDWPESEKVWDYIGIGVYEASTATVGGNTSLMSQSGMVPANLKTVTEFNSYAQNTPGGTILWNYYQWTFTKMATYMVGMGKNSQQIWGDGNTETDVTSPSTSGLGDTVGPYMPLRSETNTTTYSKVFIENTWGSLYEFVGDVVISNRDLYAGQNATKIFFDHTTFMTFLYSLPDTTAGNKEWISGTTKGAANWDLPSSITSTDNHADLTKPGDMVWTGLDTSSKVNSLRVGGNYESGTKSGVAFVAANRDWDKSFNYVGSRLTYYFDGAFDVTVTQGEHGTTTLGTKTGTEAITTTKYGQGVEVTFKNEPVSGYRLKNVDVYKQGDESIKVTLTEKTLTSGKFTMPGYSVVIKPEYEALSTLSITSGENGSVKVNGETVSSITVADSSSVTVAVPETKETGTMTIVDTVLGANVTYTIVGTPDSEFFFNKFTDGSNNTIAGGDVSGIGGDTIKANFFKHTVTVYNPTTGGTVTSSEYWVTVGHTVTLTAHPAEGYRLHSLEAVTTYGEVTLDPKTLTVSEFIMPAADVYVHPVFEEAVTISFESTGAGSITITKDTAECESPITVLPSAQFAVTGNVITITDTEWGTETKEYTITASPSPTHGFELFYKADDFKQVKGTGVASELGSNICANFTPNNWSTHVQGKGTATSGGSATGEAAQGTVIEITCAPGTDMRFDSIAASVIGTGESVPLKEESSGQFPVYSFVMPNASVWIDVVFVEDTVTVSFEMNDHGTQVESQTIIRGHTATEPTEPTAKFYDFEGWFSDDALTVPWNFVEDVVQNDLTLYAKWEVHEYTVTFIAEGSDFAVLYTNGEGKLSHLPDKDPFKTDYYFTGWYTEGSQRVTTNTVFNDDTDVYAHWEKKPLPPPVITVNVTFDAGTGGSVAPMHVTVPLNSKVTVDGSVMRIGSGSSVIVVKAVPDKGYAVSSWSMTEGNILSDTKITVTFKKVNLTEISVCIMPVHLKYNEGDTFDPKGLALSLKYDDGSEAILEYKGNESMFSFSPSLATPLKASDDHVAIGYGGKSVDQAITVYGEAAPAFDWIPILIGALIVIAAVFILVLLFKRGKGTSA